MAAFCLESPILDVGYTLNFFPAYNKELPHHCQKFLSSKV